MFYQPWVLFIWGACWGSFLNVVMYRFPLGKSIVFPASSCPSCNKAIAGYDNIPILAWLFLRGKCRHCKAPISIRYPFFEALFGTVLAVSVMIYPDQVLAGLSLGHALLALIPTIIVLIKCKKSPIYLNIALLIFGGVYGAQFFF